MTRLGAVLSSLLLAGSACAHKTASLAPDTAMSKPEGDFEARNTPSSTGRCAGQYTEEARRAGLEGTVILDIVVGEDGWVRDVTIVQGLALGLSEAAVRALKACRFTPGERNGKPVAVRVRGFKVNFALREAK